MHVIDEATLREAIGESEALESAERAFLALADDRVMLPPPMAIEIPAVDGEAHVKGAYLSGAPIFAVKIATGFYRNVDRGLPNGSGLILVFDATTGFPLALLADNGYLTELRTAAAGALAARLLAPSRVDTIAVIGTGVQARFQLRAISRVCGCDRVLAWSPEPANVEVYCEEMSAALGLDVRAAGTAEEAVRNARLVVTATPSQAPIVRAAWVGTGTTVIAVGSDGPHKRELEAELVAAADKVVADRTAQCVELGEIHHAIEAGLFAADRVYAELGEVVAGSMPGREAEEVIVCDLTGVGAQDAAIAEIVWSRLGSEVNQGSGIRDRGSGPGDQGPA